LRRKKRRKVTENEKRWKEEEKARKMRRRIKQDGQDEKRKEVRRRRKRQEEKRRELFWGLTQCNIVVHRCIRRTRCFHLQDKRIRQISSYKEAEEASKRALYTVFTCNKHPLLGKFCVGSQDSCPLAIRSYIIYTV
jgi:hypothetical protein